MTKRSSSPPDEGKSPPQDTPIATGLGELVEQADIHEADESQESQELQAPPSISDMEIVGSPTQQKRRWWGRWSAQEEIEQAPHKVFGAQDPQSAQAIQQKLGALWESSTQQETPDQPVLELYDVNKSFFGGVTTQVLFDINIRVMPGEFVAIVGSSGSGKTTLLNLMGLLDTPTSGKVVLGGKDAATLSEDERAIMRRDFLGFIFQFHYLLPEYNVLENALMPSRLKGKAAEAQNRDRMVELLGLIGLQDRVHHRPSQLSGGQQQRVAILRALANDPVLVLADEPTGNLDSKSGEIVFRLMRELNRTTQKAFLMVTHDNAFAERADRLIRLVDGRVVEDVKLPPSDQDT